MARFDDVADASAVWVEGRLKQGFDGDVAVDDIDEPVAARDVLLLNKAADGMAFGAIKPAQAQDVNVWHAAVEQVLLGGEDLAGGLGLRIGCGSFVAFARFIAVKAGAARENQVLHVTRSGKFCPLFDGIGVMRQRGWRQEAEPNGFVGVVPPKACIAGKVRALKHAVLIEVDGVEVYGQINIVRSQAALDCGDTAAVFVEFLRQRTAEIA